MSSNLHPPSYHGLSSKLSTCFYIRVVDINVRTERSLGGVSSEMRRTCFEFCERIMS